MPQQWIMVGALAALVLAAAGVSQVPHASAQSAATAAVKSEVYFGLRSADGRTIGSADWEGFLAEVVAPRFPAGLTVIEASGRSQGAGATLNPTRILVLVHPATDEAEKNLRDVKAEYRKRFGGTGVFHTEQAVQIRAD